MEGQVRFIRKNGRIIPIRAKGPSDGHKTATSLKRTAGLSASRSLFGLGSMVALSLRQPRLAVGAAVGQAVAGVGVLANQVHGIAKDSGQNKSIIGSLFKHEAVALGAGLATGLAGRALLGPAIKAGAATLKGTLGAAKAFHKFAKPYTSYYRQTGKWFRPSWQVVKETAKKSGMGPRKLLS